MNIKKIKEIFLTFFLIVLSFVISWTIILYILLNLPIQTDIQYCEDIADSIQHLKLENFKCTSINKNEEIIYFHFDSKIKRDEPYDADVRDMITVKNFLNEYLNNNPESPLNSDKIQVNFHKYAHEYVYMYNFNYEDETSTPLNDFLFFKYLYADNLSVFKNLENACELNISHVVNIDEIDFLSTWEDLYYLRIRTPIITEEQKLHLKELLPNCEIIIHNNHEITHYPPETTSSTTPLS